MSKSAKHIIGLFLILMALAAASSVHAGTVLKYKFVPGQVLRYNISTTSTTNVQANIAGVDQIPAIPMSLSGVLRQKVVKVQSNGDAEINIVFEALKMDLMGSSQQMDTSKFPVITIIMSPSGEVKKTQGMDKIAGAFGTGTPLDNMGGLMPNSAFPSKALNIGDQWTQNVPVPLGGKLLVKAQLASVDARAATIKQNISGDINVSSPMPAGGITMNSKGTMSMDGTVVFSTTGGYLVRSDASGNVNMSATAADVEGDMNFITNLRVTMELIQK